MLLSGAQAAGGVTGTMSVQITLGATTYTYTESGGTDLGNYSGPNFTQKNIKGVAVGASIPNYYVLFRQDTSGGRKEVIFGNYSSGNLNDNTSVPVPPAHTAVNLGSHTIQIFTNGVLETGGFIGCIAVASSPAWSAGTITATNHWFCSEWRWQSALRPIVYTPSQIIANGWMLNYSHAGVSAGLSGYDNTTNNYNAPMATAGIVQGMGQTGERPDIGLVPESSAQWYIDPNGSSPNANEFSMRSLAEGAHSIQQCFRDDATNSPIDFTVYPGVNVYPSGLQGRPNLLAPQSLSPSSGWGLDNAHFPANSYTAFVATGDRYYLEGVVFEITGIITISNDNGTGSLPRSSCDQDRAWAWGSRSYGMAAIALAIAETWGTLPTGLPPSSKWVSMVNANTDFFYNTYVNNANNYSSAFGSGTLVGAQETWESDYEVPVNFFIKTAAAALSISITHISAVAAYCGQAAIDRLSGSSGWPQAFPVPYALAFSDYPTFFGPPNNGANYFTPPGSVAQGHYATSWSQLWTFFTEGNTAEFNAYLDPSNTGNELTVTSMISAQNNINGGGGWWLDTGSFLPQFPLAGLHVDALGTGTGGTGTYKIGCTGEIFGFGCDIPTASPCNISFSGGANTHGMSINQKFRFVGGGMPAPLSPSTDYYVIASGFSTTFFQFSTSLGGSAVNVTGTRSGACYIFPYVGTAGSPVAMSVGNGGVSACKQIFDDLAIDPTLGGFFAQQGYDNTYLMIAQMAAAAADQDGQTGASTAWGHANTMSGHINNVMFYRHCLAP